MIRIWLAVALLAVSWLPALGYYEPANPIAWALLILLGAALLAGMPLRMPRRREAALAAILLLPAAAVMPWPYRAMPLLAVAGLVLNALPIRWRWLTGLSAGLFAAAVVLLAQSLAVVAYAQHTARSHDLAWPVPSLLGVVSSLLGAETAVDGPWLVIHSMREVHRIPVTWELLLDPATLAFLVGGLTLLALNATSVPADSAATKGQTAGSPSAPVRQIKHGRTARSIPVVAKPAVARQGSWSFWVRAARILTLAILLWLPVRAGVIVGMLVHRALLTSPGLPLNMSDFLFSSWLYLGLLIVPAVLAWRLVPLAASNSPAEPTPPVAAFHVARRWGYPATLALVAGGTAVLALVTSWDPVGWPKARRVLIVERHSTWEPTTQPYDTTSYGESASYTYSAIYDYCSRFFEMSRLLESDSIDVRTLSNCDVLVIKTPTAPYTDEEVAAILQFVEQGGGLLLVGEHTDVFKSSTYLNQIARPLGFRFREDLLFRIGSAYVQSYEPPAVPHPVIAHLPPMHFAVSCSIDPGTSFGRAIIQNAGLWSLSPDYSTDNYFPEAQYRSDARYGSFIQLWGTRYGRGRVLAWTDSTIFSSFSAMEPGKPELMLAMLQWLNLQSPLDDWRLRLSVGTLAGLLALAGAVGGLVLAAKQRTSWTVLLATALLGWTVGSAATAALVKRGMPLPNPVRPLVRVAVDRTVSEVPLAQGGFTHHDGLGYGLLEQWIPRLGYFPMRRAGPEAFRDNALVVICPSRSASEAYRQGLIDYVAAGGKLLVLDSPDNHGSTANDLLRPFGLSIGRLTASAGSLHGKNDWPAIPVETAAAVQGGQPILWVGQTPVAAQAAHGKGIVVAFGCATLLNDTGMGRHWMAVPDEATRAHFDLWYGLLRILVENRPLP